MNNTKTNEGDSAKGMSLRDWFAGMALNGMLSGQKLINGKANVNCDEYAAAALEMADAMLRRRGN